MNQERETGSALQMDVVKAISNYVKHVTSVKDQDQKELEEMNLHVINMFLKNSRKVQKFLPEN